MASPTEPINPGSGSVFGDLGLEDAGGRQLRVKLAMRINEILAERRLTQKVAAGLLEIPQPHVSELKHYKLSRFSSERLLGFLTRLGWDVEIVIRPPAEGQTAGTVSVSVA